MKGNIERAYLIEQDYINNNLGTSANLIDLLATAGYYSLNDYFGDKFLYLMGQKNLSIEHFKLDEVRGLIYEAYSTSTARVFAIDENCTWAWTGTDEIDETRAKELNVKVSPLGYRGGTIITDNNDFNVCINLPTPEINVIPFKFLEEFNEYLCEKGFNTHIDNNDILLEDGKKVAGSMYMTNGISGCFAISIALSDHSYLIKELCKKQSGKIPGYLSNITKQEIEEVFNKWLQPLI